MSEEFDAVLLTVNKRELDLVGDDPYCSCLHQKVLACLCRVLSVEVA